ncbi:NACHT domain-containing protein [Acinetobacter sp. NS-4]|uniref:NACHT domain-containing protein n=1 Tax=Acinetobacter sp. NS-4 TaxID=3127956 RepID=UPI00307FC737
MQEEILKGLISELIKQFTLPIYSGLKRFTKDVNNKIQVTLDLCFSEYLARNYERYSKTKTLLYRDMPVNLKDFYVRTDLKINSRILDENKFINEIEENKRLIVLGSAGCGKSTFCKSLFVELIEKPIGIFPIFIELRHLNNSPEKSLYNFILNSMVNINPSFNKVQLEYALKLGKVLVILDGFDEVNNEERENIEREILSLSNNYHGIRILISSRFDSRFSSWEEFYQYYIQDLDKNKALTLINKLNYDRQVKQSFLKELDNNLYESHLSFASNPLLLTMMLLTYEQIAEIPNKIHLFYEQAFLTLFNKHDSLKSMYKRKSYSQLPLDDFKRCLEGFCILSYCDRLYSFEESQIFKYLNNAIKLSNTNTNSENFLNDLLDSVCILQRDGLGFTFTHRSFQEYFTAQFLVNRSIDGKIILFDKIFSLSFQDNVINMVYDINSDLFEKEWVIPKVEKIILDIKSMQTDIFSVLNKMYSSLSVIDAEGDDLVIGFGTGNAMKKHSDFCFFMMRFYNNEYKVFCKTNEINSNFKEFEEDLINFIQMNGDIDLNEIERIDPYAKELIRRSGVFETTLKYIEFLKYLMNSLKLKHSVQDADIMSLIFGK